MTSGFVTADTANNPNTTANIQAAAAALATLGLTGIKIYKTNVNLKSATPQAIATPSSGDFVPLVVIAANVVVTGFAVAGVFSIGSSGSSYLDFAASATVAFNSLGISYVWFPATATVRGTYTNASPLKVNVTLAATATTNTADFYSIGIQY